MFLNAGFPRQQLLYTSDPALGIPLGEEIPDYLHQKLSKDSYVIFMISNNWYTSPICENEMGAVWHENLEHCNVFLPDFSYYDLKNVASPSEMALSYHDSAPVLRDKLGQLRRQLEKLFNVQLSDTVWEYSRDQFLAAIH